MLTDYERFVIDQVSYDISLSSKRLKNLYESRKNNFNENEFALLLESVSKLDDMFNKLTSLCRK